MRAAVWDQAQYQDTLESHLHFIFPQHRIWINSKKEVALRNSVTGKYKEVDAWVPELHLCFEFQDFYHYKPAWYCQMPLSIVQQKDDTKRYELTHNNQTLVAIPCWWDGSHESLQATIFFHRPELPLPVSGSSLLACSGIPAIPINPPSDFLEDKKTSTQLMLASFLESNLLERGEWWLGEKWDGVRCFWNANEKQLYSRSRFVINLKNVATFLGDLVLDAELWCGRGFFDESQAIMTSQGNTNNALMRLVCFDEASAQSHSMPFEDRYALILSHTPSDHPTVINASRFICETESVLQSAVQSITDEGGEGVMLRKPLSQYIPGNSDSLFKIKASYSDQEALVVNVEEDGSLLLQQATGSKFYVGKHDCVLPRQAVKGDIVAFRVDFAKRLWNQFQNSLGQGTFDGASRVVVYRIRSDLAWEDVAHAFPQSRLSVNNHASAKTETSKELRREMFDKFAEAKGVDPLNPVFWYNLPLIELRRFEKGNTRIAANRTSLTASLQQAYPDIGLQQGQFKVFQPWISESSRRDYFDRFAAFKGKDPRLPSFWYNVTPVELRRFDAGYDGISEYYGSKLPTTLAQIYPDIGLKEKKFKDLRPWQNERLRREYFDNFAAERGVDALNPAFWYTVTMAELDKYRKGLKAIIANYGNKLSTALMQLYPDIGLRRKEFKVRDVWQHETTRRAFFDSYAASKGKDPLNPRFWYSVTTHDLRRYDKGYTRIAAKYGDKLSTTLLHLYPDIGLRQLFFRRAPLSRTSKPSRQFK